MMIDGMGATFRIVALCSSKVGSRAAGFAFSFARPWELGDPRESMGGTD
jgi:hypothetical protein